MPILQTGTFSFMIRSNELSRGLRPSRHSPRNAKFLTQCTGAIGIDNVLQALAEMDEDQIDISGIGAVVFPYPQLFSLANLVIICAAERIYELDSGVVTLGIGGLPVGTLWSLVDFHNFVYMSNGVIAVERSAESGAWSVSSQPIAGALCNFNGQVFAGAIES